jgi:hypothetical protein
MLRENLLRRDEKDGVVRWRRIDLKRVVAERLVSSFIRAMSESF